MDNTLYEVEWDLLEQEIIPEEEADWDNELYEMENEK
jgi:hypothetical protein